MPKIAVGFMSNYWMRQKLGLVQVNRGLILAVALQSSIALAQSAVPNEVKQRTLPATNSTTQPQRTVPLNPSAAPALKPTVPAPKKTLDGAKPPQVPLAPSPATAPTTPLPPLPPIDTSKPPPMLPRASREQMHACADQWHEMKMSPTQNLPMWRHFAARCLAQEQKTQADK